MPDKIRITLAVNGTKREAAVEPRLLLVHFLREDLGLTGTHVGCDTSNCSACAVLVDGKVVKSCSVLAVQADGREILTVEGLAKGGQLHPVQKAFLAKHGLQCGFCTPGMIMSAYALLKKNRHPTRDEIKRGISGNVCRCTGYQKIIESVEQAARNKDW
ncbi:MAG TPA: (2Fe-2S)-binding protein [Nitrososphaerales archaeon]|nr:(2Fe-2S)-binding protein [Nitrososphaerales archaeon]